MMAPILGIDPGHSGAAVLLDLAGDPVWAARWRPLKRTKDGQDYRVYRLDVQPGRDEPLVSTEHRTLAGVGAELADWMAGQGPYHLVAEGLFVASMARQDAAIELGRTVGWLTSGVREAALSYDEPRAAKWRPAVLSIEAHASSDLAEARALLRWRARWSGELVDDAHVAEADAIGWFRRGQLRLLAAQPALLTPARKPRRAR